MCGVAKSGRAVTDPKPQVGVVHVGTSPRFRLQTQKKSVEEAGQWGRPRTSQELSRRLKRPRTNFVLGFCQKTNNRPGLVQRATGS